MAKLSAPPSTLLLLFLLLLPSTPFLLSPFSLRTASSSAAASSIIFPPTCRRIECPKYDVVDEGEGYQIRRYNSSVWISTSKIDDISLVSAGRTAFYQLFDYIQGKNEYAQKIKMTAPVISQVSPSDGPLCASSFVVSFYVPAVNQPNPPRAEGLHLQRWGVKYVAVRQFGGFVSDDAVGQEAAALHTSLQGSSWASAVEKGRAAADPSSVYTVAQYNSPFEFKGRVNEIWMVFDFELEDAFSM